ncbi:hypothetical protein [Undibacterium sp. Ji49W]|uniref:hypothetical protein n=1 Tax=Undibacterium sp. Ji49W TaxID=3413040 RepID=UPI003BF2E35F
MRKTDRDIAIPEARKPFNFYKEEADLQWVKIPGVVMHDEAAWNNEVCHKTCMTLAEAKAFAAGNDRITFFFYVKHFTILAKQRILHAGDVVFFSGKPVLGTEAGADVYEKPAPKGRIVSLCAPQGNGWVSLQASMQVPFAGIDKGVIFIWPGLQPGGDHFAPVGRGVLQPVLTYCSGQNTSCAPNPTQLPEVGWWISGQYVNTENADSPVFGCFGGPRMAVRPGDILTCRIVYDAATQTWTQTILNTANKISVSFPMQLTDLDGQTQEQNIAYFCLENPGHASLSQSVSLFNIVARVARPHYNLGQDMASMPCVENLAVSDDQTTVSIDRVIIYSPIFNTD